MKNFTTSETRFLVFILMMVLFSIFSKFAGAQAVKKDSAGYYVAHSETKPTHDSICRCGSFKARDGQIYPIFIGKKGSTYVWMKSKKGLLYRKYIKLG